MIVGVVETVGRMRYGNDGAMLPDERKMMQTGLAGTLARLPASVTRQVADLSAPMMAAFGLMMYVSRLSVIEAKRRAERAEDRAVEEAENLMAAQQAVTPDANGQTGTAPTRFRRDSLDAAPLDLLEALRDRSSNV